MEVGGGSTVGQEIKFYNSRHLPYQEKMIFCYKDKGNQ